MLLAAVVDFEGPDAEVIYLLVGRMVYARRPRHGTRVAVVRAFEDQLIDG
jgi:hypothetical protein